MSRPATLAVVGAGLAMLAYCALELRLGTDITRFMPDGSRSELAQVSARLSDSAFTRTMIVSVGASELQTALAAARDLAAVLRAHPQVAWVRSALDETQLRDLYELYFPRRYYFLSDDVDAIPALVDDAALRQKARHWKRRLASPAATFFEPLVAADPLGSFEGLVENLRSDEPALRVEQGQLVTSDGRHAIVLAATRGSAFDSGVQGPLLADLDAAIAEAAARHGDDLAVEISAASRFAVSAERSIKRDVYWVGACSFLGVATLFVAFVGSLRGFLIVSIPPLSGILVATTVGLLVFGSLDGLTMAFGASLMGIAIDYSNHLLIHHGLSPGEAGAETARRLRPSLVLGALTTVASLAGLALTAFPAFREMSFFASVGVLAALVVSLTILPPLLERAPPLPARSRRAAAVMAGALQRLERLPRGLLAAAACAGLLLGLAIPGLRWSDDMTRLARFDPELIKEDRRVRARVARLDTGRFVIGLAPTAQEAVALNDRVHRRLARAIAEGALEGSRSLHRVLWSEELQRANWERIASDRQLAARVERIFAEEGFRPGAFGEFASFLEEGPPPPLSLADLRASPLADLLAPFVVPLGDGVAVVTYLRGVHDLDRVSGALDGLPGVHLLDQRTFVDDIYREFRQTTLEQMLVGGGLVLLLLLVRYRAWRPVLASFLPSAVVAVAVLGTLSLSGVSANLLHVMSLVMVMGMGVDYGVFLVDSRDQAGAAGATMLSLLMSCLTTAFVFGTLVISAQPALRAIGVTTGVGVLLSYALAPLALAAVGLARPTRAGRSRR